MQINNKLRVFSGDTDNIIADDDLGSARVSQGAVLETKADSGLYNSLSRCTSLPSVALTDFIAKENPSITFGQDTPIDTWIEATNNAIASKSDTEEAIQSINDGFASDNPSEFGDYIIPKKKLLFSNDNGVDTYQFTTSPKNRKFEIVVRRGVYCKTIICEILPASSSAQAVYCNSFLGYYETELQLLYTTLIFSLNTNVLTARGYIATTNVSSGQNIDPSLKLLKIYEIIE